MDEIEPFKNCPAMDGYHCQTSSLAKIFHFNNCPMSEELLLGLGAGMGFIYWQMKYGSSDYVFIGGRGNNKNFFDDIETGSDFFIKTMLVGLKSLVLFILLQSCYFRLVQATNTFSILLMAHVIIS